MILYKECRAFQVFLNTYKACFLSCSSFLHIFHVFRYACHQMKNKKGKKIEKKKGAFRAILVLTALNLIFGPKNCMSRNFGILRFRISTFFRFCIVIQKIEWVPHFSIFFSRFFAIFAPCAMEKLLRDFCLADINFTMSLL